MQLKEFNSNIFNYKIAIIFILLISLIIFTILLYDLAAN